ncbi:hypothetical protein ACFX14_001196 [Malus domestica]
MSYILSAALDDLQLGISDLNWVVGVNSFEPVEAVPKLGNIVKEVHFDDLLDRGDIGVLVEHLWMAFRVLGRDLGGIRRVLDGSIEICRGRRG